MEEEPKDFIGFMKNKIAGKDPCGIINMDQTTIIASFQSIKMLETKGLRTIHVHESTTDTKRITLAATVDVSRKMLSPLLTLQT